MANIIDELIQSVAEEAKVREARALRPRAHDLTKRYSQVKAAVRPNEKDIFYDQLPDVLGAASLSDVIRDYLIARAKEHGLLPADYV